MSWTTCMYLCMSVFIIHLTLRHLQEPHRRFGSKPNHGLIYNEKITLLNINRSRKRWPRQMCNQVVRTYLRVSSVQLYKLMWIKNVCLQRSEGSITYLIFDVSLTNTSSKCRVVWCLSFPLHHELTADLPISDAAFHYMFFTRSSTWTLPSGAIKGNCALLSSSSTHVAKSHRSSWFYSTICRAFGEIFITAWTSGFHSHQIWALGCF